MQRACVLDEPGVRALQVRGEVGEEGRVEKSEVRQPIGRVPIQHTEKTEDTGVHWRKGGEER